MFSLGKVSMLRQTSMKLSLRGFCSIQQLKLNHHSYPIQSVIIVSKHKPSNSVLASLINNSSIFSKNHFKVNCCRFYCSATTTPPSSSPPTVKSADSVPAKKDEQKPAIRTVDPYKLTALRKAGKKETDRSEPIITESMIEDAMHRPDGRIMTFEEKVWDKTATPGYTVVIVLGVILILTVFYNLWMEFFSKNSPNSIYSSSFKLVKANQEVQDLLGTPIKAYGEETRRGYRRHVAHQIFYNNHIRHIRMKYYVQGPLGKGTVHLEKLANDRHGDFETYSFLVVDIHSPLIRIVIEPKDLVEEEADLEKEEEEDALAISGK